MLRGIHEVGSLPSQELGEEGPKVLRAPDGRDALYLLEQGAKITTPAGEVAVGQHLRVDHDRRGNHEPHWLDESQPLLVGEHEVLPGSVRHGV